MRTVMMNRSSRPDQGGWQRERDTTARRLPSATRSTMKCGGAAGQSYPHTEGDHA